MKNKVVRSENPSAADVGQDYAEAAQSGGGELPMLAGRYVLSGPSQDIDPRTSAIRGDLADIAFAGKVFVPHYAVPVAYRCIAEGAELKQKPVDEAPVVRPLAAGERFALLDIEGHWAWGYCMTDHLVGHILMAALEPDVAA